MAGGGPRSAPHPHPAGHITESGEGGGPYQSGGGRKKEEWGLELLSSCTSVCPSCVKSFNVVGGVQ